jgi:hypothetical protein
MNNLRNSMAGAFLIFMTIFSSPAESEEYSIAPAYMGLRSLALGSKASEILGREGKPHEVYGAIFEVGMEGGAATIVSMADGSISLYASGGGGMLGLQGDEQVRRAAKAFLLDSKSYVGEMRAVSSYPLPPANHVTFYILTVGGVMTAERSEPEIRKRGNTLFGLYEDAQRLIFEIQRAAGQRN